MAWNMPTIAPEEKELLYDLRQAFVIITTEIKKEIVVASVDKDFPRWQVLLDRLFIEISKNLKVEEVEAYEKLYNEKKKILIQYASSFLKKTTANSSEVYDALRTLDLWLNRKMNEKNMYGSKDMDDTDGL